MTGFFLIDKPAGITSSGCVQKVRRLLARHGMWGPASALRIGHAGTLDCYATGLLVMGVGRQATRRLSSVMTLDKVYRARARMGQLTNTLDATGATMSNDENVPCTEDDLRRAIADFGGGYLQTPPIFCACKHDGVTLSARARRPQCDVQELAQRAREKARPVTLHACSLLTWAPPFFTIEAHVSHGTYVRSLMNDIAQRLATVATTHELRRLTLGPFRVGHAISPDELEHGDIAVRHLMSIEELEEKIDSWNTIRKEGRS